MFARAVQGCKAPTRAGAIVCAPTIARNRPRLPRYTPRVIRGVVALTAAVTAVGMLAQMRAPSPRDPSEGARNGDHWFHITRAYPTGTIPSADALNRVMRERRDAARARPALAVPHQNWVSIGPSPIHVANTLPFAGRITAVATHPTLASTFYIGADGGGIWRTTDAGATWTSLTDDLPVPAIQSIAIDPVNPQLIYASTIQRTYPTRWLSSTDGGATWSISAITLTDGRQLSPALCAVNVFKACIPPSSGRILIDPTRAGSANTSRIYFVGASHLLRSDDSGRTFTPALTLPVDLDFAGAAAPTLNPEAPFLRDAEIDPSRPNRLFAVVAQPHCLDASCIRMSSDIVAYRTLDAGGGWTMQTLTTLGEYVVSADLNIRYADPGAVYVPRARVAVARSAPDTVAIAVRDLIQTRPRVFRSTTAGDAWMETTPPATSLTWPLALAFSPTDANTMYVGSNAAYRTTNGGQTWATLSPTHADNIVITFTADGVPLIGSDGGLYRGSTGNTLSVLHHKLPITEFYSVSAHPSNPYLLAGGTQDNGTLVYQGALGWSLLTGGDGGDTVWDPSPQSTILYAEIEWLRIGADNTFQFFRCQVGSCLQRRTGIDLSLEGPFIPRMAMDPSNSSSIWLTVERLFRTDNRGDSWTAASPSVRDHQRCWRDGSGARQCASARYFTAAVVAPAAPQTVFAGTLNGDVWRTADRGLTWQSVSGPEGGPLPVRAVTDIVSDPLSAQTAYVAYSGFNSAGAGTGHVFRTTNGGQSWIDISGNLPDLPVNSLLIDPDSVGGVPVLFAGTDVGVYRSVLDGTNTWTPFGNNLPPVVVARLAWNPTTRQLLAATYGRGVWAISSRFSK